jgi:hypothetical protein
VSSRATARSIPGTLQRSTFDIAAELGGDLTEEQLARPDPVAAAFTETITRSDHNANGSRNAHQTAVRRPV